MQAIKIRGKIIDLIKNHIRSSLTKPRNQSEMPKDLANIDSQTKKILLPLLIQRNQTFLIFIASHKKVKIIPYILLTLFLLIVHGDEWGGVSVYFKDFAQPRSVGLAMEMENERD